MNVGQDCTGNTLEIGFCLKEAYEVLEQERQRLEEKRITDEKSMAVAYAKTFPDEKGFSSEIERNKTGHLFELYREKECFRQRPRLGTAATIMHILCKINMTKQRVEMLRRLLNE